MKNTTRVFTYFNLHTGLWSMKALDGEHKGKVIGHAETVLLKNATGRVSEAGRQRVIKEKRKNVHAGIIGELISASGLTSYKGRIDMAPFEEISKTFDENSRTEWINDTMCTNFLTYNPYKYSSFMRKECMKPFTFGAYVHLSNSNREVVSYKVVY